MGKGQIIFFDVGDTLLKQSKTFESQIYEFISSKESEVKYDFDSILSEIIQSHSKRNKTIWDNDKTINEYLHDVYFTLVNNRVTNPDLVTKKLLYYMKSSEAWKLIENTEEILNYLHKKGYTLGVISNWGSNLRNVLEDKGIAKYFDVIVSSAVAGYAKPHKEIFFKALRSIKEEIADIKRIYMVGDSWENDIYPCFSLNIKPVFISKNKDQFLNRDMMIINSITNLKSLF
ncbi:HAD family hydrolase [Lysinibacillus xylanilyticus]|uniref:HAD family hydrolase n=1 Tax=Lysinibacillus xylanilyticus TaxID=582475 RepID=UPI003D05EB3E